MNSPSSTSGSPSSPFAPPGKQHTAVRLLAGYVWALAFVILAVGLKSLMSPTGNSMPALLFFGAITLSAWHGGLGPGLLASFLSALACGFFFLPPQNFLQIDGRNLVQLTIFFSEGAFISILAAARRSAELWARDEAERARHAEVRVIERDKLNRAILDSLVAHIAVLDRNGNIIAVNQAWEDFGHENSPKSAISGQIGTNYLDICRRSDDPDAQTAYKGIHEVLSGTQHRFVMEYACHSPQVQRWFLMLVTPLHHTQFSTEYSGGAVVSHIDISTRRQAEIERMQLLEKEREARALAESANRSKDEFLAVMSHELRTPLNSILGWAQLLNSEQLDSEISKQALAVIRNSALAQSQLVNDLLDVSTIVTGKMTLELMPLELQPVVQIALDMARPVGEEKNLTFVQKYSANPRVMGDPRRLQQIIWNLVNNAVKFSPPGSEICICLDETDTHAQFSIADKGIGIAPEFLPYVFDRFRQADSSATRPHGGLGLGLSIVRHLTELHGGAVRVVSAGENQGATFTVELPLLDESSTETDS